MNRYAAFGLVIESSIELPEFDPGGNGAPDVTIRRGEVEKLPPVHDRPGAQHHIQDGESILILDEIGRLRVTPREIVVDANVDCADSVVRAFIVGPGIATLLVRRGYLVLHASAVELDGAAVAFVGLPSAGKSTTAAALHALGRPLVTDDILPTDVAQSPPQVFPGFARLKMWRETAEAVGVSTDGWAPIYPHLDKAFRPAERMTSDSLPLARVYVLDEGEDVAVEQIAPGKAVVEILTHTWATTALTAFSPASHLRACAEVARAVPVRRLRRPLSLERVGELARAVELDLQVPA
jgi:hypothetical protein